MKQESLCSIILLSYNQVNYTKQCIESIRKYTNYPYEIIVVDNASDQETIAYLEEQPDIRLIENRVNAGFAGGCNQGIKLSRGSYIVLLNNDTLVTRNWLSNMVKLMESNSEIDMTGPLTNSTVGKQMIKVPYGEDMERMQEFAAEIASRESKPWRTLRLVAFCLLIRRSLIDEIGMLDESFQIGNYEDDDFNIKALLAGKKAYICRNSFIHHFMNVSFRQNNLPREQIMHKNKLLLEKKWDSMNWNHHAVFNSWMLKKVTDHGGTDILHIGCGLGALAVELKENNPRCHITGVEDHPIRKRIAAMFLDEIYDWDSKLSFLEHVEGRTWDTVIIECMLEKSGPELLERLKPYIDKNTQVMVRVFNIKHITTLEKLVTGRIEGALLCAASDEFSYYFGKPIGSVFQNAGYCTVDETEVSKSLSIRQEKLMESVAEYPEYCLEARIYNRIYELRSADAC